MPNILAAADIGSNTAHILIADAADDQVVRVENRSEWIALGQIVATHGEITAEAQELLMKALRAFKKDCKAHGASEMYVFGTEAIRKAKNASAVLAKIKRELGLTVDIITGERETELSLLGTSLDMGFGPSRLLLEVGGGSAQIARVDYGEVVESVSCPIGTGRLVAESNLRYPAASGQVEAIYAFVQAQLAEVHLNTIPVFRSVVCSGGVARGLWRALHPDGDIHIHRKELEYLVWACERLPVAKIGKRFGVKSRRASSLLPGAIIYSHLLDKFGALAMVVSEFGVREGAVLEMARGMITGCEI